MEEIYTLSKYLKAHWRVSAGWWLQPDFQAMLRFPWELLGWMYCLLSAFPIAYCRIFPKLCLSFAHTAYIEYIILPLLLVPSWGECIAYCLATRCRSREVGATIDKKTQQMTNTCLFVKRACPKKVPAALVSVANMGWGYQHWPNIVKHWWILYY